MTERHAYEMLLPCWCGDTPDLWVHDNSWWCECSLIHWRHGYYNCPEVGGSDGYETPEEAVMAWNKLMVETERRVKDGKEKA